MTPAETIAALILKALEGEAKQFGASMAASDPDAMAAYEGRFRPIEIANALVEAFDQPPGNITPLVRPAIGSGGPIMAEIGVMFVMPILGEAETFSFACRPDDEITCLVNNRRSLARMRREGGVSWLEMLAILTHVPKALLQGVTRQEAKDRCIAVVIQRAEDS